MTSTDRLAPGTDAVEAVSTRSADGTADTEPPAPRPVVSAVIVSYNSARWLERCLPSLRQATRHDMEAIVVDNASQDGSADTIARRFPSVRLVRNETNVGFARAVNRAAALARGDYLLLLNPDGWLESGAVDALVEFARSHPEHVIVGGRTLTPDGELDPRSCWAAPSLRSLAASALLLSTLRPRSRWFNPEAMVNFRRDEPRAVDVVAGCLLLVARHDWQALGGFDERFFMYGEDADLCLRARSITGRSCAITPDAVMVHAGAASSATRADKRVLLLKGRITLVQTHLRGWRGRVGARLIVAGVGLRAALEWAHVASGPEWSAVWRRRSHWQRGYGTLASHADRTATPSHGRALRDRSSSPGRRQ